MSGCGTDRARLAEAFGAQAEADLVGQTIDAAEAEREAARKLPALPLECRRRIRSGVKLGDRLDHAVERTDIALGAANKRLAACAAWYDRIAGNAS